MESTRLRPPAAPARNRAGCPAPRAQWHVGVPHRTELGDRDPESIPRSVVGSRKRRSAALPFPEPPRRARPVRGRTADPRGI